MTGRLLIGALFVGAFTWLITWLIMRASEIEAQHLEEERRRLDHIMRANEPPPKAAGLKRDQRRVS